MAGKTTTKTTTRKKTTTTKKATEDKDVQVAPGVVATDNVPDGALETNEDGSVNVYDADGNKVGTATAEEAAAAEAAAAQAIEDQTEREAADKATTEQKNDGKVKVKAVVRYLNKKLNEIVEAGTEFRVSKERAAELEEKEVAKITE